MSTTGCSTSERIAQPEGGYISPETLEVVSLYDDDYDDALNPKENVRPDLINTAVDHMTRFAFGLRAEEVFARSLAGAVWFMPLNAEAWGFIPGIEYANEDNSIINALKLSVFDDLHVNEDHQVVVEEIDPDEATIENVKAMVWRSIRFFNGGGPNILTKGFMTFDTLWDLSTSEARPTKEQTLQLLIRWRGGLRCVHAGWFRNIRYLGIYNPRLNKAYRIKVDAISQDAIDAVDRYVLGCSEQ